MSKHENLGHKTKMGTLHDLSAQGSLEDTVGSDLLSNLDEGRRGFLKKLLVSAVYITPVVLTFSMRDADAKKKRPRPTRKGKGKGKGGPSGPSGPS